MLDDVPGGAGKLGGPRAHGPAEARGARVLVIDADGAIRDRVIDTLRAQGHEVIAAPDGAAALGSVGPHWQPDLILLDVELPDLDVRAFVHAYDQTSGPRAPIVLLTAAPDVGPLLRGLLAGAGPVAGVLRTPVDPEELVQVVARQTGYLGVRGTAARRRPRVIRP